MRKTVKQILLMTAAVAPGLAFLLAATSPAFAEDAQSAQVAAAQNTVAKQMTGVHRTDLSKNNLDIPGYEEIQARTDIAPGVTAPNHKHPGEEIIYVIEGTIEYRLQGQPPVTLRKGDVLFIPTGVVHSAKNVGNGDAAELGTYIVPTNKPLIELVK
jgi:quercetin dioxygenase-like cupin family protein